MRIGVLEALGLAPTTRSTPQSPLPSRPKRRRGLLGRVSARYSLTAFNSNFSGSQAEDLLTRIETLLAAGYLLQREYPQEQEEDGEGDSRIKRALDLLEAILSGKLKLLDSNGSEFGLVGSGRSGRSIATTVPATDDSERPSQFSIGQVF